MYLICIPRQKLRATHTSTAQNIRRARAEIDGFHKETADVPLHTDVTLFSEAQLNRWAMQRPLLK